LILSSTLKHQAAESSKPTSGPPEMKKTAS
jgi:hypothetical protein